MKFDVNHKPVGDLWKDYLAYIVEPAKEDSNEYKKQKIIFFSAIVMFIEYLKVRYPKIKGNPTPKQKAQWEKEFQEIYDQAQNMVKAFVPEGADLGG